MFLCVRLCVCVCVCVRTRAHMCARMCMHASLSFGMLICTAVLFALICFCVYIFVFMCVCVCVCVSVSACVCVSVCLFMVRIGCCSYVLHFLIHVSNICIYVINGVHLSCLQAFFGDIGHYAQTFQQNFSYLPYI